MTSTLVSGEVRGSQPIGTTVNDTDRIDHPTESAGDRNSLEDAKSEQNASISIERSLRYVNLIFIWRGLSRFSVQFTK